MATPDDVDIEQLRADNDKLHHKLDALNAEIDKMHKNRTKPGAQRQKLQNMSPELRAVIAKNEQLRRERLRLHGEVSYSDTAQRIAETKNKIGMMKVRIEKTLSDIKSYENLKRGQQDVIDFAKQSKEELSYLQSERTEEMNKFRQEYRELSERVKVDEKRLVSQHNRFHVADQKLKFGMTEGDVDELRYAVEGDEEKIAELEQKLKEVSAECADDRKRETRKVFSLEKERDDLNKRITFLEETLKKRDAELKRSYGQSVQKKHTGQ